VAYSRALRWLLLAGWAAVFIAACRVLARDLIDAEGRFTRVALLVLLLLAFGGLCRLLVQTVRDDPARARTWIVAILAFGTILRLGWALSFPTTPQSDFACNHEIALRLSHGDVLPPYGRNIGYPAVLALTYLIHPDPVSGRILNVVFSALSIYLVYGIGKLAGGPLPGLLSALFMTLSVSDIMMTSVLCTDVGSLTLMLASLYFFFRALREPGKLRWMALSGAALGVVALFRPNTVVYLPAFLMGAYVACRRWTANRWKAPGALLAAVLAVLAVLPAAVSIAGGRFTLSPLILPGAACNIFSGTNLESRGEYDEEDSQLCDSWPEAESFERSVSGAVRRIRTAPAAFAAMVPEKMASLLADNTYGSAWVFETLSGPWSKEQRDDIESWMTFLAQAAYLMALGAGFTYFLRTPKLCDWLPASMIAIMLLTILPHILLVVQGRYHHILLGPLSLAAGFGISGLQKTGQGFSQAGSHS
jgi:hypothetical protein